MRARPSIRPVRGIRASCWPVVPAAARLPHLVRSPLDVTTRLAALRVAVIGAGGSVGQRASEHLARLQVAHLLLIDPKILKRESALTHTTGPETTGRASAWVTGRRCKRLSPATAVAVFVGPVQALPLDALLDMDVVVVTTDNPAAEMEAGQRCLHLGLPLIQAALQPEMLVVQVRCLSGRGACLACGFGPADYEMMRRQVRFSCEGYAAAGPAPMTVTGPPTRSFSYLCGLAADLALNQLLRLVLALGRTVEDTVLEFCGYTNRSVVSSLVASPACRCDHARYEIVRAAKPLAASSLADLARTVGCAESDSPITFRVGEHPWVARGACACDAEVPVERFVDEAAARPATCARCQSPIQPLPFHTFRDVPPAVLGAAFGRPLRRLGAGRARFVIVRAGDRAVLVRDAAAVPPAVRAEVQSLTQGA